MLKLAVSRAAGGDRLFASENKGRRRGLALLFSFLAIALSADPVFFPPVLVLYRGFSLWARLFGGAITRVGPATQKEAHCLRGCMCVCARVGVHLSLRGMPKMVSLRFNERWLSQAK
nr:hypothetical protein [Pandoravirus massiliensis]